VAEQKAPVKQAAEPKLEPAPIIKELPVVPASIPNKIISQIEPASTNKDDKKKSKPKKAAMEEKPKEASNKVTNTSIDEKAVQKIVIPPKEEDEWITVSSARGTRSLKQD
jgi:hypothetical protein